MGLFLELLGFVVVCLNVVIAGAIIRKSYMTKQDPSKVIEDFVTENFKNF